MLQAEVLSHHGEEQIQERPIDFAIAATPDEVYNGLVCAHLAPELGRERVFQLSPSETDAHTGIARDVRGKALGDMTLDFDAFEAAYRAALDSRRARWRTKRRRWHRAEGRHPLALVRANGALSFLSPEAARRLPPSQATASSAWSRLLLWPGSRPALRYRPCRRAPEGAIRATHGAQAACIIRDHIRNGFAASNAPSAASKDGMARTQISISSASASSLRRWRMSISIPGRRATARISSGPFLSSGCSTVSIFLTSRARGSPRGIHVASCRPRDPTGLEAM